MNRRINEIRGDQLSLKNGKMAYRELSHEEKDEIRVLEESVKPKGIVIGQMDLFYDMGGYSSSS
jgi:hypothetical protein